MYDAAGNLTKIIDYAPTGDTPVSELFRHHDGSGREAKRTNSVFNSSNSTWEEQPKRYYISSSVLGGEVVSDVDETGRKLATSIFASGRMVARQTILYSTNAGDIYTVEWKNQDSFALSDLRTRKDNLSPQINGAQYAPMELDPTGTELWSQLPGGGGGIDPEIPTADPSQEDWQGATDPNYYLRPRGGAGSSACAIGSVLIDCSRVRFADGNGNGVFGSLERAVRMSAQQTGWRTSGVSWGTPFTATYGNDGSRSITWGRFNPGLAEVNYGNTTAIYSSWSVTAFSQQQTQQTQEPPGLYAFYDPKKDFKAFLKANPNCKKALKKLGVNIEELFRNAAITNTVTDPSDLGKTYRQLGSTEKDMQEYSLDNMRLLDDGTALAETVPGTNRVYLYSKFFRPGSGSNRGQTIVHELLHIAFGNHVPFANRLGYEIPSKTMTVRLFPGNVEIDPSTGLPNLPPSVPVTLELNDGIASVRIGQWLSNNCTRPAGVEGK